METLNSAGSVCVSPVGETPLLCPEPFVEKLCGFSRLWSSVWKRDDFTQTGPEPDDSLNVCLTALSSKTISKWHLVSHQHSNECFHNRSPLCSIPTTLSTVWPPWQNYRPNSFTLLRTRICQWHVLSSSAASGTGGEEELIILCILWDIYYRWP